MTKKQIFRLLVGSTVIGGALFLFFQYLFKSPPIIKVFGVLSLALLVYIFVDWILGAFRDDDEGDDTPEAEWELRDKDWK